MLGDRSDMIPVTQPAEFGHCQHALIDPAGARRLFGFVHLVHVALEAPVSVWRFGWRLRRRPQWFLASLGRPPRGLGHPPRSIVFFSASILCAQIAASSLEPSSRTSAISRSRNCADASAIEHGLGFARSRSHRAGHAEEDLVLRAIQLTIAVPLRCFGAWRPVRRCR